MTARVSFVAKPALASKALQLREGVWGAAGASDRKEGREIKLRRTCQGRGGGERSVGGNGEGSQISTMPPKNIGHKYRAHLAICLGNDAFSPPQLSGTHMSHT